MKCSVCYGRIKNKRVNLLGENICGLCIKCMGEIDVDNIFYDYYKDRIKHILKVKLITPLPQ